MLENIYNLFVFIALFLDSIIYSLISWVYQIILVLCQVDILNNSYEITQLMNRLYIVIGVIVLFLLAYSLLKSMVNPDDALKNKKGPVAIIKDVIISIVLIALVPSIFSFAQVFQQSLLMENTIGKIILGNNAIGGESSENTIENGGIEIASNILQAFLHPTNDQCTYIKSEARFDCSQVPIATENTIGWIPVVGFFFSVDGGYNNYDAIWESIKDTGNFLSITSFAYSISHESVLSYYFIISTAVGIFVLLVLLSYCIDIAIRAVKLAVFQLIAPLPILARIMPNEQGGKVFSNWLKATLSTYLEVFIRLAILFFAVLLIKIVVQQLPSLFIVDDFFGGEASFTVYLFAQLFIIVGIIFFIKQAPGIIKDITGLDGGKYNVFGSAFKAAAMLGGGVTAAVRNWNTKNPDGSQRRVGERIRSAAGGFGSAAMRSTMHRDDVKGFKDVRQNAHNSAEEAIKKRIARENSKRERDAYFQSEGEPTMEDRNIFGKAAGAVKYKAHGLNIMRKEWAGEAAVDPITLTRTKEFADKIDSGFAAIEGTWKKTQAFIDAKAETEKLSKQESAMKTQYNELINQGLTSEQASARLVSSWGVSLNEISEKAANAKAIQTEIERSEQKKKAESIATAARNIQLSVAQYSDIKLDQNAILAREDNEGKRQQMQAALQKYGNLDNNVNFQQLIKDLQSSDHEVQDMARSLLDYYDKMNLEAKAKKGEAAYQEEMRKSTLNSKPSDGGKK